MGSANSVQGFGAGTQSQSPESMVAQVVRQLSINWGTFDREYQAVFLEWLTRVLCTTGDGVCGLTNAASGGAVSVMNGTQIGAPPSLQGSGSPPQQPVTSCVSSRPLFATANATYSTRSTNTVLSSSFPGARCPATAAGGAAANNTYITPQDVDALALAFLSLEMDGCLALFESLAFIVSGQTRRVRMESQVTTPTQYSVQQQGPTPSTGRSASSQRFATAAAGPVSPGSRGHSAPVVGAGLLFSSLSNPSSFLMSGSQDSLLRASTNAQLYQLQRQHEQMRVAPTSFGEQAYNNALLMSMSARSSNSDLRLASRQHSGQHSGIQLSSSRASSSIPMPPARSQPSHLVQSHQQSQRRISSLDNLTGAPRTPLTGRVLTPHAPPPSFANAASFLAQSGSNVSGNGATVASRPASRRPSFASGTRPAALATQNSSMVSMSSAALAELPQSHHTAAALTYMTADHSLQCSEKLTGHTQASVLKSVNALLAHLHVPEHSVTALWVLFFEVVCDVQERAASALAPGGASNVVLNTPSTASFGGCSRTGANSHAVLQPAGNTISLSSTDDPAPSQRLTCSNAISTACRLAVVPIVEKLVLPHYADVCATLAFASGCDTTMFSALTELAHADSSDGRGETWRAASASVSEARAGSVDSPSRSGVDNVLRHSLPAGLPSLTHGSSASAIRPSQMPTAHSRQLNNYMSGGSTAVGAARARSGSVRDVPMASIAQQYFREESTMLLGRGGGAHRFTDSTVTASGAGASTAAPLASTAMSGPLVQKSAFVLHYAERIALAPGASSSTNAASGAASTPSVVSLWQMRTRMISLRQHYLYVYDAMATTIALLGGDLSAPVASPSANVELNAPIALMDLAGAAGSDLRLVSGPSDAEVMPVRASRTSRGRPAQSDPLFSSDEHHNADLLKGTRSEDTTVYRVQNKEGELFLLVLPVAGRRQSDRDERAEFDAITATATELEQRLSRPDVLSLMSADGSGGFAHAQPFTRVQGEEHVALSVHPLRLLCQGVLHHFFFQNANVRAQWFDHIMATTTMLRSRRQVARVTAAPQQISEFVHRRISYPVGPAAFEYLDMLGVGGFGRVLLVRHRLAGKLFAMKIIRKFKFHGMRNVLEVRRECHTLRSIDNPYVMKIHTIFQTDSRVYILLDYLPGGELLVHTQKTESHHFDNDTARFFIAELAIALEALREQGIVHRDIKGDNVVLDADGHAVLTDFGFAKTIVEDDPVAAQEAQALQASPHPEVRRADDTRHPRGRIRWQHSSCGTLAYLAPEVLQRTPPRNGYGLEADWWSLGVVLFTMLTGYFPFLKEDNESTKRAIIGSSLQFPPKVPLTENARDLMMALMEKDPLKRISTLAQMRRHPFFNGFDWAACEARRLRPPVLLHKDMYKSPSSGSSAARRLRDAVVGILEREQYARERGARGGADDRDDANAAKENNETLIASPRTHRAANDYHLPTELTPNKKYLRELEEEIEELQLVEEAFGPDVLPVPTTLEGDIFGPLYAYQEECGSDREDVFDDDVVADRAPQRRAATSMYPSRDGRSGLGAHRIMNTGWFDPIDGNYIPYVDYSLPLSSPGMRGGVGSAALLRAQERENALLSGTAFTHPDPPALSVTEGELFPTLNDFDEAAYMSLQDVHPTDARLASDATGLFRPLIPDSSQEL